MEKTLPTFDVVSNPARLQKYLENPKTPGDAEVAGDQEVTGNQTVGGTLTVTGAQTFTGRTGVAMLGLATGSEILSVVKDLTNANIKALRATPFELVAAPGTDKVVIPLSVTLILEAGTEGLTESTDNLIVGYNNGTTQVGEAIETTGFIDQTSDTFTNWFGKKDGILAASAIVNKNIALKNSGDGEIAGNATNDATMRVVVVYQVVTCGL